MASSPGASSAAPVDKVMVFLNNNVNIDKLRGSMVAFSKYKIVKLQETKSTGLDLEIREISNTVNSFKGPFVKKFLPDLGQEMYRTACVSEHARKIGEKSLITFSESQRVDVAIGRLDTFVKTLCQPANPTNYLTNDQIKARCVEAIENLREQISGDQGDVIEIRRQIENLVIEFAESWESFTGDGGYRINMVFVGGAGVGKTTLAKAASKCLNAFGILSTNIIKMPEKQDLIGEYIGQTAPKTAGAFYDSLEGVCFIDEAYSIAGNKVQGDSFGQEFIDTLVLLTQKYPGMISVMVAGYKKEMDEQFFSRNEGLPRRFPTRFNLNPYPIETLKKAFINNIMKKLPLEAGETFEVVKGKLAYFTFFLSLAYLDPFDVSPGTGNFDGFFTKALPNFFEHFCYNLEPLVRMMYLTTNVNKRILLKSYVLQQWFQIKNGDLLPNQMGDIGNLTTKTLSLPDFRTSRYTVAMGQQALNDYFKMRENHSFFISSTSTAGKPSKIFKIDFVPNNYSAPEFETNVLKPLFEPVLKKTLPDGTQVDTNFFGAIENEEDKLRIGNYINSLYTKAVLYYNEIFNGEKSLELMEKNRPPAAIKESFVKAEAESLAKLVQKGTIVGEAQLQYFEGASDFVNVPTSLPALNSLVLKPQPSVKDVCAPGWIPTGTKSPPNPTGAKNQGPDIFKQLGLAIEGAASGPGVDFNAGVAPNPFKKPGAGKDTNYLKLGAVVAPNPFKPGAGAGAGAGPTNTLPPAPPGKETAIKELHNIITYYKRLSAFKNSDLKQVGMKLHAAQKYLGYSLRSDEDNSIQSFIIYEFGGKKYDLFELFLVAMPGTDRQYTISLKPQGDMEQLMNKLKLTEPVNQFIIFDVYGKHLYFFPNSEGSDVVFRGEYKIKEGEVIKIVPGQNVDYIVIQDIFGSDDSNNIYLHKYSIVDQAGGGRNVFKKTRKHRSRHSRHKTRINA